MQMIGQEYRSRSAEASGHSSALWIWRQGWETATTCYSQVLWDNKLLLLLWIWRQGWERDAISSENFCEWEEFCGKHFEGVQRLEAGPQKILSKVCSLTCMSLNIVNSGDDQHSKCSCFFFCDITHSSFCDMTHFEFRQLTWKVILL